MTEKEYLEKRKEIDKQYKRSISDLEMEYCLNKTTYSVGDIVQDPCGVVLLTDIKKTWHEPGDRTGARVNLMFEGIDLRKSDLTPKKNGGNRAVFEHNIKKVLKKNVQE